jgi:hypothetical protein
VLSMAMVPVMMIVMFSVIPLQIAAAQAHGQGQEAVDAMSVMSFAGIGLLWLVMIAVILLLMRPLSIVASITQDFAPAFNLRRLKSFVRLMWPEILMAALFMWVVSFGLMLVGAVAVCIGMYFTMSIIYFVNSHLDWQLYHLYVARGGEPIPLSAKLSDSPPPLPPPFMA